VLAKRAVFRLRLMAGNSGRRASPQLPRVFGGDLLEAGGVLLRGPPYGTAASRLRATAPGEAVGRALPAVTSSADSVRPTCTGRSRDFH
jgi:hypothetical protein